ncbi:MAG: GntR family transcriptional regulator [Chloroflexota bacterium]
MNQLQATIPLYIQIAEGILDQIQSGAFSPGDRIQPERELSEALGVNRRTVREALRVLEAEGLIERKQGVGTFVAQPKIEREVDRLFSFTKGMRGKGLRPGANLITLDKRIPDLSIVQRLKLQPTTPVYYGIRLRLLNNEHTMLEKFYLPYDFFPDLNRHDLNRRSLYEVFQTEYGITPTEAVQSIEAVKATEFESELLGIPSNDPVILERRLTFDQFGRPIESAKDVYRGDRFRFTSRVRLIEE